MGSKTQQKGMTVNDALSAIGDFYFELTGMRLRISSSIADRLQQKFDSEVCVCTSADKREDTTYKLGYAVLEAMNVAGQTTINGKAPHLIATKKLDNFLQKWIKTGDMRLDAATAFTFSIAFRMSFNVLLVGHAETKLRTGNTERHDVAESIDYWFKFNREKFQMTGLFDFLPEEMIEAQKIHYDELVRSRFGGVEFMRFRDNVIIANMLLFTAHLQNTTKLPHPKLKISMMSLLATMLAQAIINSDINLQEIFLDPIKLFVNMPDILDIRQEDPIESILADPTYLN